MKQFFRYVAPLTLLLFMSSSVSGQFLQKVNYQMKYDQDSCRFDCYMIVTQGSATSSLARKQASSQYSIVVPTGTGVSVAKSHNPIQGDPLLGDTDPIDWAIASAPVVAPAVTPDVDYYSITPNIGQDGRYGNLAAGDTVLLFSLAIDTVFNCAQDIRIWHNDTDPTPGPPNADGSPNADGMGGAQFDNGFTVGSFTQLYDRNDTQIYPPAPIIVDVETTCSAGLEIDLTASTSDCQGDLAYNWTGPGGFSETTQDISRPASGTSINGLYQVTITDEFGCLDSLEILATGKPNAGADFTACAGTLDTLTGTDPNTGVWTVEPGNPAGLANISPIGGGQAIIDFEDTASGDYTFYYGLPSGCLDTAVVTINPKPILTLDGTTSICIGDMTDLNANVVGTWVSEDENIATIDENTGEVTGVAVGNTTFTFTNTDTGCSSESITITVQAKPSASAPSPGICVDGTLQAIPANIGGWTAVTAFASITANGMITGVAEGTAAFVYQEVSSGCYADTVFVDITDKPEITFDVKDFACIGEQVQLSPILVGTWTSSDTDIAEVSNTGLVTAKAAGVVQFTFTDINFPDCPSDPSGDFTVHPDPVVSVTGPGNICIGKTTTLSPVGGGKWVSNDPGKLSVDSLTGVVTALENGFATFTYTDDVTGCSNTTGAVIVDGSPTVLADAYDICIGNISTFTPGTSQGSWEALNPAIANLRTDGRSAEGIAPGSAGFIFTDNAGCKSDTLFVEVDEGPIVDLGPISELCVNETLQLPDPGIAGFWSVFGGSTVASVTSGGFVIANEPGTVQFIFTETATLCTSVPTGPLTVNPIPTTQYDGDPNSCIDETSQILPNSGGLWTSTNPLVASIDDTGLITNLMEGTTQFQYTDTTNTTGCASELTAAYIVYPKPTVSYSGDPEICLGTTAQLTNNEPGIWSVTPAGIGNVTNDGLFTPAMAGTATFVFTATNTDCPSDPIVIEVTPQPSTPVVDDNTLCVGDLTTATTDQVGGSWGVNGTAITIDEDGNIVAVSQGSATVFYLSDNDCASENSVTIVVDGGATVQLGAEDMCIGETSQLTPASGNWTSSNTDVATVDMLTGEVEAIAAGEVYFTYTDAVSGCTSSDTEIMTVNPRPDIFFSAQTICVGANTQINPSVGGTWISSNPNIASITNTGFITGVAEGKVVFTYTDTSTLCISLPSDTLTVTPGTTVDIADDEICIGDFTTLSPSIGGTWAIDPDPAYTGEATVTELGVVQGIAGGPVNFIFTSDIGCTSTLDAPLLINNGADVSIDGPDVLCIGETTQMIPGSGGTWASSNDLIAEIDEDTGEVTAIAEGTATFTFTSTATGCTSAPSDPVTVNPAPIISITGETDICIGATTTLGSNGAVGEWTSNDEDIAIVDNNGLVTAIAAGEVTFTFVESGSGCEGGGTTEVLAISACADPDFNATYVDIPVLGDVSTNDQVPAGTSYGPTPSLKSSPVGSIKTLTINSDGTYEFIADAVGVYVYDVPVCVPPITTGCATAELTITVVDFLEPDNRPVANLDIATTEINTAVTLATMSNDRCVVTTGCTLDPSSVTITANASNGSGGASGATGDITYTPNAGFIGYDTLTYRVCVTGEPANCASAKQIILVNSPTAANTTQAADDFAVTPQGESVSGDVLANDTDPEADGQGVITTGSFSVAGAGTLTLAGNGSYTFVPDNGFFGPVDFIYTLQDDNSGGIAEASATLHILVVKDLHIKVRAYLSGSMINNGGATAPDGRPLMRDGLRKSPFNGQTYIPSTDPFTNSPSHWLIPLSYDHEGAGLRTDLSTVESSAVFAVSGQDAIVDWVSVELRDRNDYGEVIATRAALLQRDGDIVDIDGWRDVRVPGVKIDDYYVVVQHRNHLGAMTLNPKTARELADLVDFTVPDTEFWDYGSNLNTRDYSGLAQNNQIIPNYLCMWAGDMNNDGRVKYVGGGNDYNDILYDVLLYPSNSEQKSNFDFAYGYLNSDFDLNAKSKFDNPDDDKNYLFLTVLLYPLNDNFNSNFGLMFEQVPDRN